MTRLAFLSMLLCASLGAHNFHHSTTEINLIAAQRSLEITISLHADDIEEALRKRTGRMVELDREKDIEPLLFAYVQEKLELRDGAQKPLPLRWVGMEVRRHYVTVYVQSQMPAEATKLQARNTLLVDLLADQVNTMKLRRDAKPVSPSVVFKRGTGFIDLAL